jgi:uncharacterized protein YndB with AHSA1/START domain
MPSVDIKAIEKEVKINASPETVFAFLIDPAKLRRWFASQATTDPRPGGQYRLVMADPEYVAAGTYIEITRPTRLVYTWGWEGDDSPTPVGASTVEITLTPDGGGTLLKLAHRDIPTPESREGHGRGWDKYLQRLAIAASGGDPGPDVM